MSISSSVFPSASIQGAIIYDFDYVINRPPVLDSDNPHSYDVDQEGNIGGEIINADKFKKIIQFAKRHNIALYIVTARPNRKWHVDFITQSLNSVDGFGFNDGIGGFKPERIYCLGLETYDKEKKRPHVEKLIVKDKAECVVKIYQRDLSHLPRNQILFIDDGESNVLPVAKEGFSTIQAQIYKDWHHDKALEFLTANVTIPFVSTLGNYSVLMRSDQATSMRLEETEYLEPSQSTSLPKDHVWRKRKLPNFAALAKIALKDPSKRNEFYSGLVTLGYKQAIFFCDDEEKIIEYVLKNSFGTVASLEDLINKDKIILLGSQGKRKLNPLTLALKQIQTDDITHIGIIGLPSDSGVALQPVGHSDTFLGCQNRLSQVLCFEFILNKILNNKNPHKKRMFVSQAIENGIGLYPVSSVVWPGRMVVSPHCLTSENGTRFHFYDQAHLLTQINGYRVHSVAKPSHIGYTLVSDNAEELASYFNHIEIPTEKYYLKQSEYSEVMVKKIKTGASDTFPVRLEEGKAISSDDLIQAELEELLPRMFTSSVTNVFGLGFFNEKSTPDSSCEHYVPSPR